MQSVFFSFLFLWFISSFLPLWSEKILEIIYTLLNSLRLFLCPSMWSILENIPCALEKNIYSDYFGCNGLKMWIKSNFSIVSFKISVASVIFYLEDLSISKWYKQFIQLNSKKEQPPNWKNGQKTWIDISLKKIHRWPTSTWKNAQHHSFLEKCKSKPLWGTTLHQSE